MVRWRKEDVGSKLNKNPLRSQWRGLRVFILIKFGEKGLALLLEGVEACCDGKDQKPFRWFEWRREGITSWIRIATTRGGSFYALSFQ